MREGLGVGLGCASRLSKTPSFRCATIKPDICSQSGFRTLLFKEFAVMSTAPTINPDKLNAFMGRAVSDMGAAMSATLSMIGDRLGLYKAMAGAGEMTSAELAKKTGTGERYIREWMLNQAAGGYLEYHPSTGKYSLPPEQAFALADPSSPAYLGGAFDVIQSMHRDEPKIEAAFKSGKGVPWGDHDTCLFCGTERFFSASYRGNLVDAWIPALDGVRDRLLKGVNVADVGCGHGASTIIMGKAFPKSNFVGFDFHAPSIECSRRKAKEAGLSNVRFEVAESTNFPNPEGKESWDFIACFDCLHDMGDPVGCAAHVRKRLGKDGTWMIVEPFASDKIEENLNPIGRTFSAASTMICVPASLASNGPALGAQAGPTKLREVITKGGFSRFKVATTTPFNLILEARP
jgi:SAM-dependent methyltransferase